MTLTVEEEKEKTGQIPPASIKTPVSIDETPSTAIKPKGVIGKVEEEAEKIAVEVENEAKKFEVELTDEAKITIGDLKAAMKNTPEGFDKIAEIFEERLKIHGLKVKKVIGTDGDAKYFLVKTINGQEVEIDTLTLNANQ